MGIQSLYNSIFHLYSNESTGRDNIGGIIRTAALKQGNIKCYCTYLSGEEVYEYGKNNIVATHRLFCNPLEVESTDLVRIIDDDGDNWYNITYIDDCDDLQHHFELALLYIKAPQEILESSSSDSSSSSSSSSGT